MKAVFEGNEYFNKKLLYLACVLSHMDWGLGAFQKAELVFQETINTPLLRLTHKERIQLESFVPISLTLNIGYFVKTEQ